MQPGQSLLLFTFCLFLPHSCAKSTGSSKPMRSNGMSQNDTVHDPLLPPRKTCAGSCGLYQLNDPTDVCQCDSQCFYHHDCCPDMENECPHIVDDPTRPRTQCKGFRTTRNSKSVCKMVQKMRPNCIPYNP